MADLNETATSKIDLTISDFRTSGCAWCHPGGSILEYDREGYRFDGKPGLFNNGANPDPNPADYKIAGLVATTTDASGYCKAPDCSTGTVGAGYFEVTAVGASLNNPEDTINQGSLVSAWDAVNGAWKTVGKKYAPAATAGSAEVDCLMCHISYQYSNLERNWAFNGATTPKLGASLGLVGAGQGTVGLLNIAAKGSATGNPNVAPSGWTWNEFWGATTSVPGNPVTVRIPDLQRKPRNENCALCHFPDKSMVGTPAVTGPAGKPLGYTAFQKVMPPGAMRDGDELPGVNGRDGNNDVEWKIAKGRVEGGKRGESINDPNNRDAHMKWGSTTPAGALKMACADCHLNLEGTFAGVTDPAQGDAIIQPNVTVTRADHMFAKGDNTPDGKNMDQLDNTVTCDSCHIRRTNPNAGTATNPLVAHKGFPSSHLEKISCKTCHITTLNSAMNQDLADFTVGPFRTFERTQVTEVPTGTNKKPLFMWRQAEHGQGHWEIQPFDIMSVAVVANATASANGEATAVVPTFQRLGKRSAELLRAAKGDSNRDGLYDWPLNAPQGGDTTLIVNRPDEIVDFLAQVAVAGGASAPPNPVIHFYFNQFSLSHNVTPKAGNPANGKYILGSPLGGGCIMCHSDSSNPRSVGFFDRDFQLFAQPVDGGAGLVQTVLPAAGTLSGDLERVSIRFPYSNPVASGSTLPATLAATAVSTAVNLSNAAGQTVGNSINQATLLGYSAAQLALLKNPDTASFTVTATATAGGTITDGVGGPSLLGSTRVPGFTDKAFTLTPDAGFVLVRLLVNGQPQPVTVTGMTYTLARVASNSTVAATFAPGAYVLTARTWGAGSGTVSTTDTDPDIACTSGSTLDCSGSVAYGATVTLTAAPAEGSLVLGWSGCASVSADKRTCTASVTAAKTVAANFEPVTYTLTAGTSGTGTGTVSTTESDPDISCTSGSKVSCSGSVPSGATVTLTAQPASGSIVSGWWGCTSVSADNRTCSVWMSGARTAIATFQPGTYTLTARNLGTGSGTVSTTDTDPDITCTSGSTANCSGSAASGATVTLTAQPAAGSTVLGFSGCTSVSADNRTCSVSMTAAKTVSATFGPATYTLTARTAGTGAGTVSATGTEPDISCTTGSTASCSGSAANGTTVTLTAQPASGSIVSGWSGCTSVSSDKRTCSVRMSAPATVTATFQPSAYVLTARTAGSGTGTVSTTGTDPDISCATGSTAGCSGSAANGATVTLTAEPASGSIVSSWWGCTSVSADRRTCSVSMTAPKTVYATFGPATFTLTARTTGLGAGTVSTTGTDPDISCTTGSTATCSGSAANGDTVTLTAQPAAGSLVAGWSGCASVSADRGTCTVSMTAETTVTATFQPSAYVLTARTSGTGTGTVSTTATEPDLRCTSGSTESCSGSAANGATVTLTAEAAAGSQISSWSGCLTVSADKTTCTVVMSAARTVGATFSAVVASP